MSEGPRVVCWERIVESRFGRSGRTVGRGGSGGGDRRAAGGSIGKGRQEVGNDSRVLRWWTFGKRRLLRLSDVVNMKSFTVKSDFKYQEIGEPFV